MYCVEKNAGRTPITVYAQTSRAPMVGLNFHFCHYRMSLKLKSIVKNNGWCPAKIFSYLTVGELLYYKDVYKIMSFARYITLCGRENKSWLSDIMSCAQHHTSLPLRKMLCVLNIPPYELLVLWIMLLLFYIYTVVYQSWDMLNIFHSFLLRTFRQCGKISFTVNHFLVLVSKSYSYFVCRRFLFS